ncbi:undecaprenyl-phosphate glucose phosphotransferase [bacterium]|nr:undecaprenyl-phosphate glucose phosphotransferase [bacterium]
MLKHRSDQTFLLLLSLADAAICSIAWILAYAVRWETGLIPVAYDVVPPWWWCLRTLPLVVLSSWTCFRLVGLYQLRRRWSLAFELVKVFQGTTLTLLVVLAITFYSRNPYESRIASLFFFVFTLVGVVTLRRSLGLYFRLRRRTGKMRHTAIIVGTGRTARAVEAALRRNNWLGIQPVGFVDDPHETSLKSILTVGQIGDLTRLVEEHGVDYVFVALPLGRFNESKRVFRLLSSTLVDVRLVPDVPQLASMSVQVDEMEGLPLLNLRASSQSLIDHAAKRLIDMAGSLVGLIILSPLLSAIALAVKLSDGGPVLYFQERMGLNGRRFRMIKFRTMRVNAETDSGPVWAKQQDERRTGLGAFLRRTSLDELPQLWNVLVGEMSLVGPRPERPYFINKFRESIPRYMLRHSAKAGMTGWAQVHGWRGNTSLRKRVQYDLYYIAHWSIWLDLRIILLTFTRALRDKNAY